MKIRLVLAALLCSVFFLSCSEMNEFAKLEGITVFSYNEDIGVIALDGTINSKAFDDFKKVAQAHPDVKTIHIINCDGSINDDVNLSLSRYVYENDFNTVLKEGGMVASGGTDFFLAGNKRTLEKNVMLGVHSWSDGKKHATDFPRGHNNHMPYIAYYQSVGMSKQEAEEFYYFTINAAAHDDIHWMTEEELVKYKFER
ncbi:hypothetical protein [Carboxylicivirga sp. RSCT41]|uniref:hypothetical protein n=1 Tax=Carboxylicivirga agarovorans TaxID=3417570 RepID=UPI003D3429F5